MAQAAADRAGKIDDRSRAASPRMLAALNALPKPLIARVQNAAPMAAGGIGLIAVADIAHCRRGVIACPRALQVIPATIN